MRRCFLPTKHPFPASTEIINFSVGSIWANSVIAKKSKKSDKQLRFIFIHDLRLDKIPAYNKFVAS